MQCMPLLDRLFGRRSRKHDHARASTPSTDNHEMSLVNSPAAMRGAPGTNWGPRAAPTIDPEYMAEAPLPTEQAWAREEELYREKNERRSAS